VSFNGSRRKLASGEWKEMVRVGILPTPVAGLPKKAPERCCRSRCS